MRYKENWDETRERFKLWWKGENSGRPLLRIVARKKQPGGIKAVNPPQSLKDLYMGAEYRVDVLRNFCSEHLFLAEAYPSLNLNIGPGSIATYLGAEPIFSEDTVWYEKCIEGSLREFGELRYDNENNWLKQHIEAVRRGVELSLGDFPVNIPDLVENIDILAALRGPQEMCYDLMDEPELVRRYINRIDELYLKYYEDFYQVVKSEDGSCSYTAFNIMGDGRTAKIQCDFSVFMSPQQFRDLIQPSIRKQCNSLDYTLYHLDGPDSVKHLDAILEVEGLRALQFTPGAGKPDAGDETWFPIYDKVINAGKSLWCMLTEDNLLKNVEHADRIVKRYGCKGVYLLFPVMDEDDAYNLLSRADKEWK